MGRGPTTRPLVETVAGLLHDADYEKWPEEHPQRTVAWLRESGRVAAWVEEARRSATIPIVPAGSRPGSQAA